MSRKRKRTTNQQGVNESREGTLSSTEGVGSALNSARNTISSNGKLIGAIGTCAVVAGYLVGTERGRDLTSRISHTMSDSFGRVRESALSGWETVRNRLQEMSGVEEKGETGREIRRQQSNRSPEKLRRVS